MINMTTISLDFINKSFSKSPQFYYCSFPNKAQGWKEKVYHFRSPLIKRNYHPVMEDTGLEIVSKSWNETGVALNGDLKTCAHDVYANTVHLVLNTYNANYVMYVVLTNEQNEDHKIDVFVNHILEKVLLIPANGQVQFTKQISLSQSQFDFFIVEHDRVQNSINAKTIKIVLNEIKLTEVPVVSQNKRIGIYVASDSTAQTYSLKEYPQSGWGAELYHYLTGRKIKISQSSFYPQSTRYELDNIFVDNRSLGARSSKSFILEGRLASLLKDIKAGDYLLIQFGDNDATSYRPNRYVSPTNFIKYLKQYVDGARSRGAHPILISPPTQCKYDQRIGHFKLCFNEYRKVMIRLSREEQIPFIDLGKESTTLLDRWGLDAAHSLYLQVNKADYPNLLDDKHDVTHFRNFGAFVLAGIIADHLRKIMHHDNLFKKVNFKKDYRPVIDQKLGKLFLKWSEVPQADFYVIKGEHDAYLATTVNNSIFLSLNDFKQFTIVPYKGDEALNQNVVIHIG